MLCYLSDNNRRIKMNPQKFVDYCEFEYHARCREIAEILSNNIEEHPVLLIAGPSGSGKTTTAITIEHYLQEFGYKAHTISLDNYFKELTKEERELSKKGEFDLETPDRIDVDFLNDQLWDILKCNPVRMPKFNFADAKREDSGWVFKREKNEALIMEGTHALNPDVILMRESRTLTCYVSIRTSISNNDVILTSPTIRLARRFLRDISRAHSLDDTLSMYDVVNEGEEKYIKPYMKLAHYSIDTLIPYEINLYKPFIYEQIKKFSDHPEIKKLLAFFDTALSIDQNLVPPTSMLREFIGGSILKY